MTARSIKQLDKNDPIWAGVGITVETEIEDLVAMDTSREKLKRELNGRVMEFIINDESLVATFLEQADGSNWNEIGLGDDPSAGDILHQIGRNSEVYRLWLKKWNLDKENFSRELIVESIKDYRVSLQAETQVEGGKVSAVRRLIVGQISNQKFISWMETHVDQKNRPKWM